jgi:peptide/nickel transport system substrate-binding protein
MRTLAKASLLAVSTLATVAPAVAAQCIRVIGTESSLPNITLDPALQVTNDDAYGISAVMNKLIDLNGTDLSPIPELAKSWTTSADGKTWTFKLQEGVKFSDGSDFTADDAVFSIARILDPAIGSSAAATLSFLKPEKVKAIDPLTLEITTEGIVADLPIFLGIKHMYIAKKGQSNEDLKLHPIGTGPFTVESFTPSDTNRVFKKNPNYWKQGLPKADCLEVSVMTEEVTRTATLQAGEADLLLATGTASVPVLKADPNIEVMVAPPGSYYTIAMQVDAKPFDDVRVRQALKMVIDRGVMAGTVMQGFAIPGNDTPIPPVWPVAFRPDVKARDIEGAKKLLAEAGYPDGLDLELNSSEAAHMLPIAQAFKEMAADANIRVQLVNNPADTYWDTIWLKKPFYTSQWEMRPVGEALSYIFAGNAAYNEAKWKNAGFDKLIGEASTEVETGKRTDEYKQAQKLLDEDGGVIIPVFYQNVYAMRKACSGFTPHMQGFAIDYETISCTDR